MLYVRCIFAVSAIFIMSNIVACVPDVYLFNIAVTEPIPITTTTLGEYFALCLSVKYIN